MTDQEVRADVTSAPDASPSDASPAPPAPSAPPARARFRFGTTAWLALAIGAVVVVSTAIVLLGGNRPPVDYPADTPEGTVQRYLVAWYDEDYAAAYDYFSGSVQNRMSFYEFEQYAYPGFGTDQSVTIDSTTGSGDERTVGLTVTEYYGEGPGSSYSRQVTMDLVLEDGSWKIDEALSGVDPYYGDFGF
jgi:hypothetical protein